MMNITLIKAISTVITAVGLFSYATTVHPTPSDTPYNLSKSGIVRYQDVFHPVVAKKGMVSTQNVLATEVGIDILKRGGNAIDASVAVGFALAVTLPRAGNLGGGGFMLFYSEQENKSYAIDYREAAPTGVTANHFLTQDGEKDRNSAVSWHAVGVPGTVAGLHRAWQKFGSGKLNWQQLLAPAIQLAENGFVVNYDLAQILTVRKKLLVQNSASKAAFYKTDGNDYRQGETFKQPDLAWTLKQIAQSGAKAFYHGAIADKIIAGMRKHGGHIDRQDLENYQVKIKAPIYNQYRGHAIVAMPPPSSGGVTIMQMLNIFEQFPLRDWAMSAKTYHVMAEAMKLSFADRGKHLADPDFYQVPVNWLIDKDRAAQLSAKISLQKAMDANALKGDQLPAEGPSTTHYSIVDNQGNAVSNTYTLGYSFGTGKVIEGTGFLLNNQIHTFSVRAGIPGASGFIASKANKLEAGKRPVSSQSPIIVLKDNKAFLVTGSPGGSRIINAVVQIISNSIDHQMNIAEATNQRRIHHQWLPDKLEVEPGFNQDTIGLLEQRGQKVEETFTMGSTQSIMIKNGYLYGASDPRRPNALTLGY